MAEPKRIQRKRTKGWKMPDNAVYVGRPTKWGNPWSIKQFGTEKALMYFESFMKAWACEWSQEALQVETGKLNPYEVNELRGKDLACWCPLDQPCHADILLELANQEGQP